MNTFMNGLKNATNFTYTQNGALTHKTTNSALLDMFAQGAAMRRRSDEDCILMFKKAYEENPVYALKCLFYIRDIREGQGERRFFRICMKWLASYDPKAVCRNLEYFAEYGRWDDLFVLIGSKVRDDVLALICAQLFQDLRSDTPSLLAKWMPSANTSSEATKALANDIRTELNMTPRQYRKMLSTLRGRIKVLERTMSANQWADIDFSKIPSVAGKRYRKAFARHDVDRAKSEKPVVSYADFAKDTTTKVNAGTLYPYDVVSEALKIIPKNRSWYITGSNATTLPPMDDTQRLMINKYWANLHEYFAGATFNGIAVVDTSGSMVDERPDAPINVAISLGLYCAERNSGPFANHYISFASRPQLIETEGVDFVDKVYRIYKTNLVDNTNIEAVFDLMLNTALDSHCSQDEIPQNVLIISDMEFDQASTTRIRDKQTLMEAIEEKWNARGYQMPNLVFWNANAAQSNIAMTLRDGISFVSGCSPTIFRQILTGKTAYDLMFEVLDQPRYEVIA